MFHKDIRMQFNQRWEAPFVISFLSSNNPDFFDTFSTKKGYVICENEHGFYLKSAHVSFQWYILGLHLDMS